MSEKQKDGQLFLKAVGKFCRETYKQNENNKTEPGTSSVFKVTLVSKQFLKK